MNAPVHHEFDSQKELQRLRANLKFIQNLFFGLAGAAIGSFAYNFFTQNLSFSESGGRAFGVMLIASVFLLPATYLLALKRTRASK